MPLINSSTDKSRQKNIDRLIKEGRDPSQAVAIAYSIQRRSRKQSRKLCDTMQYELVIQELLNSQKFAVASDNIEEEDQPVGMMGMMMKKESPSLLECARCDDMACETGDIARAVLEKLQIKE